MSLDRATILSSPGKVVHDGATLFSEKEITAEILTEYQGIETDAFGVVNQIVKDRMVRVRLTPKNWATADLAKLFPYATVMPGDRIYGATDKPLVITPRNGAPLTLANAAVTKLATIDLSGLRPILGDIEYTGLVANSADIATVANLLSFGTPATGAALTGWDGSTIPNGLYSATWNAITIRSKTGFRVEFTLNLQPDDNDGEPTTNYIVVSVEARVTCTPIAMTEANYLTLLNLGKGIGAKPQTSNLVITGASSGMPIITVNNCCIESGRTGYGMNTPRTGEVTFRSIRTVASNVLGALWAFSTVV